jgi:hypothetical protein
VGINYVPHLPSDELDIPEAVERLLEKPENLRKLQKIDSELRIATRQHLPRPL